MNRYWYGIAGLAAIILFIAAFFAGLAALIKLLYPLCTVLAAAAVCVFAFVILPLSGMKHLRPRLAVASFMLSMVCAACVWMYAFLVTLGYMGWFAIILSFLFKFLVPLAALGLLARAQWQQVEMLVAGALIVYMMRRYSVWAGFTGMARGRPRGPRASPGPRGPSGGVIDTTAEVIEE